MDTTLQYYEQNAAAFAEDTLHADMSAFYALFGRYCAPGALVLDLGCGAGRDTGYFLSQGYRVEAVDGSAELCRIAAAYTGIPVRQMYFHELEAVEKYDGIWACSSILHVPCDELPDILCRLHRALVPGGSLYVSFKYGDFSGDRNGRFYTDLTEERFRQLLAAVPGLAVAETAVTADVRPGRETEKWLNLLLRRVD